MTWKVLLLKELYSPIIIIPVCVLFMCGNSIAANNEEFQTVDVAKLASLAHGTELLLLENAYKTEKSYQLEDFFWTGSGDGSPDTDDTVWVSERPTIYRTKTVLSTVYIESPTTHGNKNNTEIPDKCTHNCDHPHIPDGEINPTPTYEITNDTSDYGNEADRQFWLLTVLKSDGKDPVIIDLKNSLAKLYRTAFDRQQERHLGINNRSKRYVQEIEKPVNVYIHNVAKSPTNGDEKIEVLYHVSVAGKPVAATTAAADMSLVPDDEVVKELGYPFIIKAEPYLKSSEPLASSSRAHSTWIFIGTSLIVLLILLLVVAFLTLGVTKRNKSHLASDNKRQVFEEGNGHDNKGFLNQEESQFKTKRSGSSPTYINFRHQPSNRTLKSGIVTKGSQSSLSSSISSGSSLDISPLMTVKKQTPNKKNIRPKAALNKTVPINVKRNNRNVLLDSDSSGSRSRRNSPETIFIGNYDPGVVSPKSYLSMPSVKSFPRGNMPEPLNKVLEPVSVLHLDMADDVYPELQQVKPAKYNSVLVRHGSVGAVEDPGVLGPVVWNMHCQRLQHGVSVDEGIDDLNFPSNVTRMRKRFHDLLDDTFSLFGSRRDSPVEAALPTLPVEVKSHSATNSRSSEDLQPTLRVRPKTSVQRRAAPSPGSEQPRGAWTSNAPSPLVRPLSAGTFNMSVQGPRINVDHVLAEGSLQPNDPAVPLIAAIKNELGKCSLPGSTSNLNE